MITVTFVWICDACCTPRHGGPRYPNRGYIESKTEEASSYEDYMPGLPNGWTEEGEGDEFLLRCPKCSEGRGGAAVVVAPVTNPLEDSYTAKVGGE